MDVKKSSLVISILVLLSAFSLTLTIIPENARASTLYVGGTGPGNFTRIQDAINATSPGDTIYVFSGIYNEDIMIPSSLSLTGEDRDTTEIKGSGSQEVIYVMADWVNISGLTVTGGSSWSGIRLDQVEDCRIADSIVSSNGDGILLVSTNNSTISNVTVASNDGVGIALVESNHNSIVSTDVLNNRRGLYVYASVNNLFLDNTAFNNGFFIEGQSLNHWNTHVIDSSNTVNGKPVHYLKNTSGSSVPQGVGQIILANCTNTVVENQNVSNSSVGVQLGFSSNVTVRNVTASANVQGMYLYNSNNNTVENGIISANQGSGLFLHSSAGNSIFNNTALGNKWGIYLLYSDDNTVIDNEASLNEWNGIHLVYSNRNIVLSNNVSLNTFYDGLDIRSSSNNSITNNTVHNNRNGIRLSSSHDNKITGNDISFGRNGGIGISYSNNNTIINNTLSANDMFGLWMGQSETNMIADNSVLNNRGGITLSSSDNNTFTNNNVSSNGGGIFLTSSDSNTVANNTILNNREGITFVKSSNNGVFDNLMVKDGIFILGDLVEHWNTHIIDTSNTVNGKPVYYWKDVVGGSIPLGAGQVILANCTGVNVVNQNVSNGTAGIEIGFSSTNTITNNTIFSNYRHGIYVSYSRNITIANNNASSSLYGISLLDSTNIAIANNNAFSNQDGGVYVSNSNNSAITGNNVSHNGYGIKVLCSSNNTIMGNSAWFNNHGIYLITSNNNIVAYNIASSNMYTGVSPHYSSNIVVTNNSAMSNRVGISLHHTTDSVIAGNNVSLNNMSGIFLGFSDNNRVYHNNIMDNAEQAVDNTDTNHWDNGYPSGGNYWSDYAGIDFLSGSNQDQPGSDGIGDTQYVIDPDSRDRYPLMAPIGFPLPPTVIQADLSGNAQKNVTLTWLLSLDDGVRSESVVGYRIYRNSTYDSRAAGYELIASLPNRTSAFIDSPSGEGDPNDYFYQVCAVDANNNSSCSKTQAAKFTRSLSKGPNLVSIPLIQSDETVQTVLQTLSYDNAWSYNPINQEWKSFSKSKPYGQSLEHLNDTMGIWVNVTQDSNLTVAGVVPTSTTINMQAGWNLVGFPSFDDNYTVANLKGAVAVERMEGFDVLAPPYFLRVMADGDFLQAGFGYWIRVNTATDWTVDNT